MKLAPLVKKMDGGTKLILDWSVAYLTHRIQHGTMAEQIIPALASAKEGEKVSGYTLVTAMDQTMKMEQELKAYEVEIKKVLTAYKKDLKVLDKILKKIKPDVSTTGRTFTEAQIKSRTKKKAEAEKLSKESHRVIGNLEDTLRAGFTAYGSY